jgi:hypothetical protein
MKNPRQLIIASNGLMQNILRCHTQRQQSRIDNFKLIIPQIKIDVAPLGVGTMDQRIDQQLPDYATIINRNMLSEQTIRQLVTLTKIRNFPPNPVNQLHRRKGVLVPDNFIDPPPFAIIF